MDKKKVIYICSILILTVIVSITYFSYAFFTNRTEQRGKLNIVTGTLNYKINSSDLTNNSITLAAKKSKEIEIEITSLNEISSKYELYYQTTVSNIVVGYGSNNDAPIGTINSNGKKIVKVVIKNKSSSPVTITFGVEGGFINNTLVLSTGNHITDIIDTLCDYDIGYAWNFDYTGNYQEFNVPCDGNYKVELWGAQGGSTAGNAAYTAGDIELLANKTLYVYVGLHGLNTNNSVAFNGGGASTSSGNYATYNGGGATDIRYFTSTPSAANLAWNINLGLNSRIMVAAGGGGSSHGGNGGYGGGLKGYNGLADAGYSGANAAGYGATQVSAGGAGAFNWSGSGPTAGKFGTGGNGNSQYGGGGGGGYYGGGGSGVSALSNGGGGGGSSYISGHTGCLAIAQGSTNNPRTLKTGCTSSSTSVECSTHYSGLYFTNTIMIDGSGYSWTNVKGSLKQMPNPNGGYYASGTGHTGNGYARITYLGE